jgi:FixJ family two-component response regulator
LDHGIDDTLVPVDGIRCRRKAKSLDIALEVVALVVSGPLNKQVGGELGIGEISVKAYRAARQWNRGKLATNSRFVHLTLVSDCLPTV